MSDGLTAEIRRRISNAYYEARNMGQTMEAAADNAAASVADLFADREANVLAALRKAEALTQDVMGIRSKHWRGHDYADGLDAGIELTAALVREHLTDGTR